MIGVPAWVTRGRRAAAESESKEPQPQPQRESEDRLEWGKLLSLSGWDEYCREWTRLVSKHLGVGRRGPSQCMQWNFGAAKPHGVGSIRGSSLRSRPASCWLVESERRIYFACCDTAAANTLRISRFPPHSHSNSPEHCKLPTEKDARGKRELTMPSLCLMSDETLLLAVN